MYVAHGRRFDCCLPKHRTITFNALFLGQCLTIRLALSDFNIGLTLKQIKTNADGRSTPLQFFFNLQHIKSMLMFRSRSSDVKLAPGSDYLSSGSANNVLWWRNFTAIAWLGAVA